MILFIHRTLLGALDPIIGGFREGGLRGGLASLAQVALNPVERREAETAALGAVRRELRQADVPSAVAGSVGEDLTAGLRRAPPPVGAVPAFFPLAGAAAAGLAKLTSRAVPRLGRGFRSVEQFDRTVRRTKLGLGAAAAGAAGFAASRVFPPGISPQNGAAMAQAMPSAVSATGQMVNGRMSNFAKDDCGNVLKFFCSPRPGEGWVQVEDAASLGLRPKKPFSRLDLSIGEFVRMPRRRMNPLNIKALGRANRRREDFIDICATHLRERRREREGKKPSIKNTSHRKRKK